MPLSFKAPDVDIVLEAHKTFSETWLLCAFQAQVSRLEWCATSKCPPLGAEIKPSVTAEIMKDISPFPVLPVSAEPQSAPHVSLQLDLLVNLP